jgi:UDP-N-acetylglucosamine 4-epimerase
MSTYNKLQNYLKKNKKTWLVTGVAGFIGSNLLEKLLLLNQKVVGLDNFETGSKKNIHSALEDAKKISGKDLGNNFKFIDGDIRDIKTCLKACKNIDYVLHQAALGSVPRSIKYPIDTNNTNITGFLNILTASKDANVRRLVYASSSAVYGDHPNLPKIEDKVGNPLSPYALTKSVNEKYANIFAKVYDFNTIGLRYFNIFGKRQDPNGPYAAVIPKWILNIKNKKDVIIYGDGKTSRDFCYIDNAVQANILAATNKNDFVLNQVYNIAVNDKISLKELHLIIENLFSKKTKNAKRKKPIYRDFREGDVKHSLANINKAKKFLCYLPLYGIKEGLSKTIDWYIKFYK